MISKKTTNIDWKQIEEDIYHPWFSVHFKLDGHTIDVQKGRISATKSTFSIYIDGYIKYEWNPDNFPIITKVWYEMKRKVYKKKEVDTLTKIWGKREVAKRYDFSKTYSTFLPTFKNEKTFLRQFKKLEGLEQIESEGV
ncbi:MAG: Unknown protein [uncultured Sulfurovum sp.]|uniref:Uncharacterized protein n=1 Tax=uncultured Sulfurovum sp. TaxID=269237 RepID=A0A6S6SU99_9BACT|nr:MAG: Unknown protein [uncultured Sulfurovum sp.]